MLVVILGTTFPQAARAFPKPDQTEARLERFMTRQVVSAIRKSTRVELFRIDPNDWRVDRKVLSEERIGGYAVRGKPILLPADVVPKIRRLLLTPQSYPYLGISGIGKGCGDLQPGVALRFIPPGAPNHAKDILFCFECSDLAVVQDLPAGNPQDDWQQTLPNLRIQDMSSIAVDLLSIFSELPQQDDLKPILMREREALKYEREARPSKQPSQTNGASHRR